MTECDANKRLSVLRPALDLNSVACRNLFHLFNVFRSTLYQIRGRCAAPMQDALSSLRPLRLESLGLLDRDGLIDAKIALRCFVANSAIPIEIVALDKI